MNDGGPAFPSDPVPGVFSGQSGMSLLDWYAGQALIGVLTGALTNEGATALHAAAMARGLDDVDAAAQMSYSYAQAMIRVKERL